MAITGGRRDRNARIRRRMLVNFGPQAPLRETGFTTNVSVRGLGLTSSMVHPPGTRLTLQVQLPDGSSANVVGTVAWAQRGSRSLNLASQMGIRVLEADAAFRNYVEAVWRDPNSQVVAPPAPPPVMRPGQATPPPASPLRALRNFQEPGVVVPPPVLMPAPPPPPAGTGPAAILGAPSGMPNAVPRLPRFARQLPAWFGVGDSYAHNGETNDLSLSGFSISARAAANRGTKLAFRIETPREHEALVKVQVAWSIRGGGEVPSRLGLQIIEKDRAYELMVEDLAKDDASKS